MANEDNIKHLLTTTNSLTEPEITANHTEGDIDDKIFYAAQKFIQFVRTRETAVTFHGPNDCGDKKPCRFIIMLAAFLGFIIDGYLTLCVHTRYGISQ